MSHSVWLQVRKPEPFSTLIRHLLGDGSIQHSANRLFMESAFAALLRLALGHGIQDQASGFGRRLNHSRETSRASRDELSNIHQYAYRMLSPAH